MGKIKSYILFQSIDSDYWLSKIANSHHEYQNANENQSVTLKLSDEIDIAGLKPMHLVTMACLIHFLKEKGCDVSLSQSNRKVAEYIYNALGFKYYWKEGCNHVDAINSENIFNLWRIVDTEKDFYAKNVERYLKQNFFKGKDLSAINVSLVEAFYNVFDHANAKGNAFSLIMYDEKSHILHVAVSDFGIGIAQSIRNHITDQILEQDKDAIEYSIKDSITVKSTKHNKGLGLGNIISGVDHAKIVSNNGCYEKDNSLSRCNETPFYFPGTLIFFEVNLNNLDDEEIIDTFNW